MKLSFKRGWPVWVTLGLVLMTSFEIYRNQIYKFFSPSDVPDFSWDTSEVKIEISALRSSTLNPGLAYRVIKLSIPLESASRGCEFVYGAAVFSHPPRNNLPPLQYDQPRFLFRFAYDLKNKRCESKDLSVNSLEGRLLIDLQLVDISLFPDRVVETPRSKGYQIHIDYFTPLEARAAEVNRKPEFPLRTKLSTRRNLKFSANLKLEDSELIVSPEAKLKDRLLAEIQKAKESCQTPKGCTPIQVSVAVISDSDVVLALESAMEAGVPVDAITNYQDQRFFLPESESVYPKFSKASPWMWLRGNPQELDIPLPMHSKFAIFGDDLVISSNSNYSFRNYRNSREVGMVYKGKEVAAIYQEVFTLIRTMLYYPLNIDFHDSFILLLNAERSRKYTAGFQKPYVSIRSNEGVVSSAYGILFYLLGLESGPWSFMMAPIANTCAVYKKRLCFFDLLRKKAEVGDLEVLLNAYFYRNDVKQLSNTLTDPLNFTKPHYRETLHSRIEVIENIFEGTAASLRVSQQLTKAYSLHHERFATFGKDSSLLGSTNIGEQGTLNLMEIVRDAKIHQRLKDEAKTYSEPYFIAEDDDRKPDDLMVGRCRFNFERNLLKAEVYIPKVFLIADLKAELEKRSQSFEPSDWVRVEADLTMKTKMTDFTSDPKYVSLSSYQCLVNRKTNESFVVRVLESH